MKLTTKLWAAAGAVGTTGLWMLHEQAGNMPARQGIVWGVALCVLSACLAVGAVGFHVASRLIDNAQAARLASGRDRLHAVLRPPLDYARRVVDGGSVDLRFSEWGSRVEDAVAPLLTQDGRRRVVNALDLIRSRTPERRRDEGRSLFEAAIPVFSSLPEQMTNEDLADSPGGQR